MTFPVLRAIIIEQMFVYVGAEAAPAADRIQEVEEMAGSSRQPKPQRVYVKVNSDFDATGSMTPKAIIWSDGRTFKIETVRDFRPASTLGKGCSGDCYTVLIHGEERQLFFEKVSDFFGGRVGRWWVESTQPV